MPNLRSSRKHKNCVLQAEGLTNDSGFLNNGNVITIIPADKRNGCQQVHHPHVVGFFQTETWLPLEMVKVLRIEITLNEVAKCVSDPINFYTVTREKQFVSGM